MGASLYPSRSASSGTVTMDGTEQTLYELVPSALREFLGGSIDLTNEAADDVITVRTYRKNKRRWGICIVFYSRL